MTQFPRSEEGAIHEDKRNVLLESSVVAPVVVAQQRNCHSSGSSGTNFTDDAVSNVAEVAVAGPETVLTNNLRICRSKFRF